MHCVSTIRILNLFITTKKKRVENIKNRFFIFQPYSLKTGIGRVGGDGFEPPKAVPTDLQSAPFDRSGTPPIM